MRRREFIKTGVVAAFAIAPSISTPTFLAEMRRLTLENEHFSLVMDELTGALSSVMVKKNRSELIGERRLIANFRICLPLPDYLCHYIDGMDQNPDHVEKKDNDSFTVHFHHMRSEKGSFPVELSYTIKLDGDQIRFSAKLTNRSNYPVSEFWFPRLGGWTNFGGRDSLMASPGYQTSCRHDVSLFRVFPGTRGLGSEAAEYNLDYPGMTMPWWDIFDAESNTGLYLGYHDKTFRYSTWHCYLYPDVSGSPDDAWLGTGEAAGQPVGLVFSHVRYPFIESGEAYETGEFILRVHGGNWHAGSRLYRDWFLDSFPFDKSKSWLRKQSVWFSSIIYQPEGRVIADYRTFDRWCEDAEQFGINCHELLGWQKGGLDSEYPQYFPEPKLGGTEGYRALLASIHRRRKRCLTFINYNVIDGAGAEYPQLKPYTHQDQFGQTPNWMAWGESTLIARKGLSVHRLLLTSVVPHLQQLLEERFLKLVEAGADGFQIDKLCVGSALDFNPLNKRKPDEALCEGLVQAIGSLLARARQVNPDFCIASEANQDRMLPYVDIFYRATSGHGICPLRFVFPEWTAVQHVSAPRDFRSINGAVLTGAVIGVEPDMYQGTLAQPLYNELARYIQEVERIRREFADILFLGDFFDDQGVQVAEQIRGDTTKAVFFAVHGHRSSGQRALVVVNEASTPRHYAWEFTHRTVQKATLQAPFEQPGR